MEEVRVIETSVVVPSKSTPVRRLYVSRLDVQMAARGYVSAIYLYGHGPDAAAAAATGRLAAALADALVPFYPLAGRLAADGTGRPVIDCNAAGALFVVARSDVFTAEDVRRFDLTAELRRLFVPSVDSAVGAVLAVQVTFLKCGGAVIGTATHHMAADAASAMHFVQTWSSIASGANVDDIATADLPSHDRSLLHARSPPVMNTDILSVFSPGLPRGVEVRPCVGKVFHIAAEEVAVLKHMCGGGSTFRAVASHVWRCACVARGLAPGIRARISFLANLRRHVRPPLPRRYFGNAVVMLSASADVSDIVSGSLATVADNIGGCLDRLDGDLAQSAIDYLELAASGADELGSRKGSLPNTDLFLVSWLGMPATDADFGWGNPEFMRGVDMPSPGTVRLVSGKSGKWRWCILVSLSGADNHRFVREAGYEATQEKLLEARHWCTGNGSQGSHVKMICQNVGILSGLMCTSSGFGWIAHPGSSRTRR